MLHTTLHSALGILGRPRDQGEKGDEITCQVLGVGALNPAEQRTFTPEVEVLTPAAPEVATSRAVESKEELPTGA